MAFCSGPVPFSSSKRGMAYGDEFKIFVGGLSWCTSDRELFDVFSRFGKVLNAQICTDISTGRSRGFGFITFATHRGMNNAIRGMHVQELNGRIITVNKANSRMKGEHVEWGYSGRVSFERGARSPSNYECFNCGRYGHWTRDCPLLGRFERSDSGDFAGEDHGRYEDEQCDSEQQVEDHFNIKHDDRVNSIRGTSNEHSSCSLFVDHADGNPTVSLTNTMQKQCEKCENCSDSLEHCEQKNPSVQKGEGEGNSEACLTAENSGTMLATTVLLDELSFKLIESENFQKFCQSLHPGFVIPSRVTIIKVWFQMYLSKRKHLKSILTSRRVCLTVDTWTSVHEQNYMILTAHFIDNGWDLQERILNFCEISNYEGETIGRITEKCLLEWGIDRVFTITVGKASSDDAVTRYLRRRFTAQDSVVLNGKFLYVRSFPHVLRMFVNNAWKHVYMSVLQIRNFAKNVTSSPARLQTFRDLNKENFLTTKDLYNLIYDQHEFPWTSPELVGEVFKFQYTFEKIKILDPSFFSEVIPSIENWVNICAFVKLLQILMVIDLKVSESLCIAPNEYFPKFCSLQVFIREYSQYQKDNPCLSRMLGSLQAKFKKYWGSSKKTNFLLYIVVVLDPRYKLQFLKDRFREFWGDDVADKMTAKVKSILHKMCDEHLFNMTRDELNAGIGAHIGSSRSTLAEKFKKFLELEAPNNCKNEIDNYLHECSRQKDDKDFDVLNWWKLNSSRFQILSRIAKDIFAIPLATSVFKSSFQDEARVLDRFRSSFPPKMLETIICTQNWLRSKPFMADVGDEIEDIDEVDQEFSKISMEMNLDSIAD